MPRHVPTLLPPLLIAFAGCLSPTETKFPTLLPRSLEYERREAEIQDPYPDTDVGPGTSLRPPQYNEQRSEPRRAKERGTAGLLRQQFGRPGAAPPPQLGQPYPETVR